MTWFITLVLICVGGGVGAVARSYLSGTSAGILGANLSASFALGVLSELALSETAGAGLLEQGDKALRVALAIGLLGALSTWSSLALEVVDHLQAKARRKAAIVLCTHVVGGVLAAWIGIRLGVTLA